MSEPTITQLAFFWGIFGFAGIYLVCVGASMLAAHYERRKLAQDLIDAQSWTTVFVVVLSFCYFVALTVRL